MIALIRLAWRNIWRNRRRTLLTMGAVLFSVLIVTATRSLQFGIYDLMESQAVRMYTGEIQVQQADYKEERTFSHSLREAEADWSGISDEFPFITASTRRLSGFGLVSSDSAGAGALVIGIEPDREITVSTFTKKLASGRALVPGDAGRATLGSTLARNLGVAVGDTVSVITQGFRGTMGADLYAVTGLIETGSAEMDRALMVLTLDDAQYLFGMEGRFTEFVIRTDDFRKAPEYASAVRTSFAGPESAVYDWDTLMPELREIIVLDNAGGLIFLLFMLLLLGFEIFNTTSMSVVERSREFGVLRAIGMPPTRLAVLVSVELALKMTVALVVSMGAAGLLLMWLEGNPIPLPAELIEMYEDFGFPIEMLTFSTRAQVFLEPLISIAVISGLATIWPVMKVFRLETIKALRHAT